MSTKKVLDKAIKIMDKDWPQYGYSMLVQRKSDKRKYSISVVAETKTGAVRKAVAQAAKENGGKESDYKVIDYIQYEKK